MKRAPVPGLAPGECRLPHAVGRYLARVLRLGVGDAFTAFDPAGAVEADGVLLRCDDAGVVVRFGALRPGAKRADRELLWIQGLAKGDKCDAVVRDATELGATHIVVACTRRSVARLDASRTADRHARWTRIAREAARQCGRSDPPQVAPPCAWTEALALAGAGADRFCLWESATAPLAPRLFEALAGDAALVFACGPEGGLDDDEVGQAEERGFAVTSLGPFALRTETVAAAVLGAVRVWSDWLG